MVPDSSRFLSFPGGVSGKRDPGQNLSRDSACGIDLLRETLVS